MEAPLSIVASIVGIVGGIIGLMGSARERDGLREHGTESAGEAGTPTSAQLTGTGVLSLILRVVGGVAVILAAAAYLFARSLYVGVTDLGTNSAASRFSGFAMAFGALGIVCGGAAFAIPVVVLRRPYGWAFATFTVVMAAVTVMFAIALEVAN